MAEIENLKIGSGGTIHIVGNEDIVAEAWAVGQSYVKDKSYVINNHVLYVCNTSHTSTSPFDPTNWTQITVGESLTSLVDAINDVIATSKLNPVYGNTASGSIATFDTSLALPLQDCTIAINAVQTGTLPPSPSNVCPISGFTGANVGYVDFNQLNALNDVRFSPGASTGSITKNEDNSVTVTFTRNGSDTSIKYPNISDLTLNYNPSHIYLLYTADYYNDGGLLFYIQSSGNYIPVGKNYRFYKNIGSADTHIYVRSRINGSVSSVNVTATVTMFDLTVMFGEYIANYIYNIEQNTEGAGCELFKALFPKDYYTSSTGGTKVSIDSVNGEPTCPNAQVTWQDEAGTVYGGSLDVTSGKLTVTWGSIDLGSITYQRYQASGVYYFRSYDITDIKPATAPNPANIICECYDIKTSSTLDEDCIAVANGQKIIYIRDDTYTSENALQTALSGMLLVYELETPTTYQLLTPTQISAIVGTNNIFTDTNGNTSVVYACSLKDYIDGQ